MQTEQDDHLFTVFAGDSLLQDNKKKKRAPLCFKTYFFKSESCWRYFSLFL